MEIYIYEWNTVIFTDILSTRMFCQYLNDIWLFNPQSVSTDYKLYVR